VSPRLFLLFLALLAPADTHAADATPPRPASQPSAAPPVVTVRSNPKLLEKEVSVRVQTNAPTPVSGATNAPVAKENASKWTFAWRGWDGLQMELSHRTPLSNPLDLFGIAGLGSNSLPRLQLDQVKLSGTIGGTLEVDGAGFVTTHNLSGFDDGIQLRRALISAQGNCILVFPVGYLIQLGYIPNAFYLNEAYLLSPNIDYLGPVQIGVFGPPMGLDLITSSRDLAFMEPASPLQAIAPPTEAGLQVGHPVFNQRATWALGLFGDAAASGEYGNASRNYGNLVGRVTWLALDHLAPSHPEANRLLHLGLSANVLYSVTSDIQYKSKPESYLAPIVVNTGSIDAASASTLAGEVAWVNGPFSAQGEFIHSFVHQDNGGLLNFGGFYAQVSWFLTGESRPYDPAAGAFQRLIPRHNFNFGKGGAWGAFEVSARFSHTDLNDGDVQGGRMNLLMGQLNWYLQPHVRWMFNAGGGRVTGGPSEGRLFVFQTRIGVDF
jgi:phosphate-selective porin OprO and OprP